MKTRIIMFMFCLLFGAATMNAASPKGIKIMVKENASEQSKRVAKDLQTRLDKIQSLDYNSLSHEDKVAVRKEVKAIKKEARRAGGVYIYLGGGALLLAIILLIILL